MRTNIKTLTLAADVPRAPLYRLQTLTEEIQKRAGLAVHVYWLYERRVNSCHLGLLTYNVP